MDQAGTGAFPHALPANQGRPLLARALAKRRRLLQQPARQLFRGIVTSVSRGNRPSGLAGRFDPARDSEKSESIGRARRAPAGGSASSAYHFLRAYRQNAHLAASWI